MNMNTSTIGNTIIAYNNNYNIQMDTNIITNIDKQKNNMIYQDSIENINENNTIVIFENNNVIIGENYYSTINEENEEIYLGSQFIHIG